MYERYDSTSETHCLNNIHNDIVFANLIAVVNNKTLFDNLDLVTKTKLVDTISAYTNGCLNNIYASSKRDAEEIQKSCK